MEDIRAGSSPFRRRLSWLYGALGLVEPDVPTTVDTDGVRMVLDVGQRGQAFVARGYRDQVVTGPVGAAQVEVLNMAASAGADEVLQAVITSASITHSSAAQGYWDLSLIGPQNVPIRVFDHTSPANAHNGWARLAGSAGARVVVPPNYRLVLAYPAYAAGESGRFTMLYDLLPQGWAAY